MTLDTLLKLIELSFHIWKLGAVVLVTSWGFWTDRISACKILSTALHTRNLWGREARHLEDRDSSLLRWLLLPERQRWKLALLGGLWHS